MNRALTAIALILAGLISSTTIGAAQNTATTSDHTSPSYDMKAQALLDLQNVQKKFVDLANALPADKYTWRPSPDSRSIAEVFLHVAGKRYGILGLMGAERPAGFNAKTFEKS